MGKALLVVIYADPDRYPPTFNAATLLASRFRVTVVGLAAGENARRWPAEISLVRVAETPASSETRIARAVGRAQQLARFVGAVRRAIHRDKPSVLFAYDPHALVAASLAGWRGPTVYQRHEVEDPKAFPLRSLMACVFAAARPLSKRADIVVFPDQERASFYRRTVPEVRPLIVPNFPMRASAPAVDLARVIDARFVRRRMFYRGAIGRSNGVIEAVRALEHLSQETTLRLCGFLDPGFAPKIGETAEAAGVASRVELAGFLPWDELNAQTIEASVGLFLYQAVDVNWSFSTTATNKLYEYAAAGLPAVVPDRPGFRAFLKDEIWVELVDETDPKAIAAGVERILSDPARYAERCQAARRAFEERFNYEAVFPPLLERIEALTARGS